MKVITFSTKFPVSHPRKGEPTFFVEKIMASLADCIDGWEMYDDFVLYDWHEYYNAEPKHHTIRAGNRWKVGEYFSPRVWSGKPYASKQIEFAQPIQIKKIWDFRMNLISRPFFKINGEGLDNETVDLLAKNDGLLLEDFKIWLTAGKPQYKSFFFEGQILCWNEEINY